MDEVLEYLENYIWENGFEKLSGDPFGVYQGMKDIDPKIARLVLMTLLSKTHEKAKKGCPEDELISYIQAEHFVNKKTAKDLASMYLELFSEENQESWDEAQEEGFEEFCEEEWTVEWSGYCDWRAKNFRHVPCNASAELTFAVEDKEKLHSHLESKLKANPFLSADEIYQILANEIEADLDRDMERYCNADDYYEPYLEEFVSEGTHKSEEKWKSWGLEIIDFTGTGDVDYEG